MSESLQIGMLQMDAGPDKDENLERVGEGTSDLGGSPDIVVTPEYMMGIIDGKVTEELIQKNSEPLKSEYISTVRKIAEDHDVALLTTLYEEDEGEIYNTSVFIGRDGDLKGKYRKVHLFDAFGYKESDLFARGGEVTVIEWKDLKIGLATCFDLRFPELFRIMNSRDTDIVLIPSGFYEGEYKTEQWKAIINARAHENNFFVAGVNHPKPHFVGNSMVSSPLGYEVERFGGTEESGIVELEIHDIAESEKRMPINELTQPNFYKRFAPYDGD